MMRVLRWSAIGLVVAIAGILAFGPREPAPLDVNFDAARLGSDVSSYLQENEALKHDIRDGQEKRVIWAEELGKKTSISIVYIHGFSASSEEIRPVPDNVAAALGANLYYARLTGHGRTEPGAMSEARVADWMRDIGEALAIGRRIGERVLLIGTSTGGTLIAAAASQPGALDGVAGIVMVSPNFEVANPAAMILTWPAVRWWGPIVAGRERVIVPRNAAQEATMTTRYPTVSLIPMGALVAAVGHENYSKQTLPLLVFFSDADKVVSADAIREFMARWGGPVSQVVVSPGPGVDSNAHVLAGRVLSPAMTAPMAAQVLTWLGELRIY